MSTQTTVIRPSSRIIHTIGSELIGDPYASIIELVKNSYDADSKKVDIKFDFFNKKEELKISILDNGHGMSQDVVLNKWLVPGTKDKLERKTSPGGRPLQGRKGIGRFAASLLGQELLLSTVDGRGNNTTVFVDWSIFDGDKYLDQIEVLVESVMTQNKPSTELVIFAKEEKYHQWGRKELSLLTKELRKLKPPLHERETDSFEMNLAFVNCPFEEYNNLSFEIDSFPIIDLFDYRISGKVSSKGTLTATYENNYEANMPIEELKYDLSRGGVIPGPIAFDIRAFDRDTDAISNLINKGLTDPISNLSLGKLEARRLLDEVFGVNLYRGEFRVRPYGNGGYDWLELDKRRIQNPSLRISNNQVVGFITIEPEQISNLEEKSARDGLKENGAYFRLVEILQKIISHLEERRFIYRKKTGKGRKRNKIQEDLNELFSYSELTTQISSQLKKLDLEDEKTNAILKVIQKDAEKKTQVLKNIQNTIAIYQGQATLGKIVTVLLHEGRKPIGYFRQQAPNLSKWLKIYREEEDWSNELYEKLLDRLTNFKQHSDFLGQLFKRLDPLAKQKRGDRKEFKICNAIKKSRDIFESSIRDQEILFSIECDDKITLFGWEDDLIIALTNFIENSIYWLEQNLLKEKKEIEVIVLKDKINTIIHYKDSGPGINKEIIKSGVIFEPGYSKKTEGTGLGLPISGEAIDRLKGSIIAHYSNNGAYFTIEFKNK